MNNNTRRERIVISVGGSVILHKKGISVTFLKRFNQLIRKLLEQDPTRQFFLVIGGGTTSRKYRDAGRDVVGHELTSDDLDWLGIHATRLNAHLVKTIFRDIAHPYVIKHFEIIRKVTEPVIIAAGWKPGWSTDFCNTLICEDYKVNTILNLSNIDVVYDKDPRKYKNAKPQNKMRWTKFRKLVGDVWIPGMNTPFDPIAAKRAQKMNLKVVVIKGDNFPNLQKYFDGKDFVGTVIEGK